MKKSKGSFKILVLFGLRKPEDSRKSTRKKPKAQRDHEQIPQGVRISHSLICGGIREIPVGSRVEAFVGGNLTIRKHEDTSSFDAFSPTQGT